MNDFGHAFSTHSYLCILSSNSLLQFHEVEYRGYQIAKPVSVYFSSVKPYDTALDSIMAVLREVLRL